MYIDQYHTFQYGLRINYLVVLYFIIILDTPCSKLRKNKTVSRCTVFRFGCKWSLRLHLSDWRVWFAHK